MLPHRTPRQARRVSAAARSTNLIEPARTAGPSLSAAGLMPLRNARLSLSDEDLRRQIQLQISKFGPLVARTVSVDVWRGDVTLSGAVGSDYERSLIEQSVGRLAGINELDNRIAVESGSAVSDDEAARFAGLRSRMWEIAAVEGVLVAAVGSLLLIFQLQTAAAGEVRSGRIAQVADGGHAKASAQCVVDSAAGCRMTLEMPR